MICLFANFCAFIQILFIHLIQIKDIMLSKKQQLQKDLAAIMAKPIGNKNPIFSTEFIVQLHSMFSLYADPRQRRADIRDILMTAGTLGLDQKYQLVYRALQEINQSTGGHALDFQGFLTQITNKIGNPFTEEGRLANFTLLDVHGKGELDLSDLRYINQQLHYGYQDHHLTQIIQAIAGFDAETIPFSKFNRYIATRVGKRKIVA